MNHYVEVLDRIREVARVNLPKGGRARIWPVWPISCVRLWIAGSNNPKRKFRKRMESIAYGNRPS